MNAADILGDLLGGKGGGIFKDIFGGAGTPAPPSRERKVAPPPSQSDIAAQARELEDMISLTAITLDTEAESSYLDELAHGLRLPREIRNHLHQRLGLPVP